MNTITNPTNLHCTYGLCPLNVDICRVKLDFIVSKFKKKIIASFQYSGILTFQVFSIAGPQTGTTDTASTTSGGAIGTCYRDVFSLSSGGNFGSPLICGYNTGQHSKKKIHEFCCVYVFIYLLTSKIEKNN